MVQCQSFKIKITLIYEPSSLVFKHKTFIGLKNVTKILKYSIAMLQHVTKDANCLETLIVFSQKSAFCL